MEATDLSPTTMDLIADEHDSLANIYERILAALQAGPGKLLPASSMLDELAERMADHFAHEEQGGYFDHIVALLPWRKSAVDKLKQQHADLLRTVVRLAQGVRMANESSLWYEAVRAEFAEFLRHCVEHEATENRLVQEGYLLDVAATD